MLNLLWGYILVFILIIGANMGLFLSDSKLNAKKTSLISLIISILFLIVLFLAPYLKENLSFLINNYSYLFILVSVALFLLSIEHYNRKVDSVKSFTIVALIFYILIFALSSQAIKLNITIALMYTILLAFILFLTFHISKLLHYAKRPFELIINEFMILESIFIFICGLTYLACKDLVYSMFSSFLILTPTYQLVYVIITMILIMIVGLYYNDKKMKKF